MTLRRRATNSLALFIAAVVVTWLAPLVHPASYARLCSATGDRYVQVDDAGIARHGAGESDDAHAAHCPLCLPAGPLPFSSRWTPDAQVPVSTVATRAYAAHVAALVGAAFPPRAPPLLS